MKTGFLLLVAIALMAGQAFGGIASTPHDLRPLNTANSGTNTEICVYCHTPHGAALLPTNSPLWNRVVINADATVYLGADLDSIIDRKSVV